MLAALVLVSVSLGCDVLWPRGPELKVPSQAAADSVFRSHGIQGTVAIRGNVVEVSAQQSRDQLERGGTLWAQVGPYIYLLSPATMDIFETYDGVAAVRARTLVGDEEVARATLVRDTLHNADWRQARVLLAQALREGTARPARLEELVRWGERFTDYQYNPAYVEAAGTRQ